MSEGKGNAVAGEGGGPPEIRVPAGRSVEVPLPGGGLAELTAEPGGGELVLRPEVAAPERCGFCGRAAHEVWLLVRGPAGACICDNCLAFSLAAIAEPSAGRLAFAVEGAPAAALQLAGGPFETVRRCGACGTYTLSPSLSGPAACAGCGAAFPAQPSEA